MNAKPEWLESLSVLHLQPGDVLVLRSNGRLQGEAVTEVSNGMRQVFPNHKTVILDQLDLGVVRHGEIGFTWEDVDRCLSMAHHYEGVHDRSIEFADYESMNYWQGFADRIAALLPPRGGQS
jgi:hypothetical protein